MFEQISLWLEIIISGAIAYNAIVILLRISGERTLTKWNSFDFVATIAFGSLLASSLTSTGDRLGK